MGGQKYIFGAPAKVRIDKDDAVLGLHPNPSIPLSHAPDCWTKTGQ